jgi:hypothetical protein
MSTWLSGVIGQGIAANIGAQGLSAQQVANMPGPWYYQQQAAQQQAIAGYSAQQAYGGLMGQGSMNATNWSPPKWMFNGTMMSIIDFANSIWPEDCPDKTAFVLKYSE